MDPRFFEKLFADAASLSKKCPENTPRVIMDEFYQQFKAMSNWELQREAKIIITKAEKAKIMRAARKQLTVPKSQLQGNSSLTLSPVANTSLTRNIRRQSQLQGNSSLTLPPVANTSLTRNIRRQSQLDCKIAPPVDANYSAECTNTSNGIIDHSDSSAIISPSEDKPLSLLRDEIKKKQLLKKRRSRSEDKIELSQKLNTNSMTELQNYDCQTASATSSKRPSVSERERVNLVQPQEQKHRKQKRNPNTITQLTPMVEIPQRETSILKGRQRQTIGTISQPQIQPIIQPRKHVKSTSVVAAHSEKVSKSLKSSLNKKRNLNTNGINGQRAHMPQLAVNLTSISEASVAQTPIGCQNQPQAIDMSIPFGHKKMSTEIATDTTEVIASSSEDIFVNYNTEFIQLKNNRNLEDIMDEDMELTAQPTCNGANLDLFLKEAVQNFEKNGNNFDGDPIDSCLRNFNSKTPSEIDNEIANTSAFFDKLPNLNAVDEKTPLELDAELNNTLIYDDDDEDLISVATSWDGMDDDTFADKQSSTKEKTIPRPLNAIYVATEQQEQEQSESAEKTAENSPGNFRIPKKVSLEEGKPLETSTSLREQPVVMQALYMQSSFNDAKRRNAKHKRISTFASASDRPLNSCEQVEPQTLSDNRRLNCFNNVEQSAPVFPLPYRLDVVQPVCQPNVTEPFSFIPRAPSPNSHSRNIMQPLLKHWVHEIFGVKCYINLDNACSNADCNHSLSLPGDVMSKLSRMGNLDLIIAYRHTIRNKLFFQNYFHLFADIFSSRKMASNLIHMVGACANYRRLCAPQIQHIYACMCQEMTPDVATSILMTNLWFPAEAVQFPDLSNELLKILAASNWYDYTDSLVQLFYNPNFKVPHDFLNHIIQDTLRKNTPLILSAVWKLIVVLPFETYLDEYKNTLVSLRNRTIQRQ
ncbi:protein deadlock isoform X2 [Scaptodrosophila lebanonensis]|uniref:Protein deadlock isoform X2 n=1 Tax=Drosophila lebanonensis TaxID=7225 RepID=A0A6J2TWK4_DROLE|nr:protein deadlock isoform X2 [Scaptodrosophila lebanonensis]